MYVSMYVCTGRCVMFCLFQVNILQFKKIDTRKGGCGY